MGFWFNLLFYYDLLVNGRFPQDRWDYDSPILTIISHNPGLYASYSSIYHSMSVCFLLCFSFLRMLNLVRFQRVTTMEFPSHQIQFSTLWRNPWSYNSEYLGKKKLCRVFKIFSTSLVPVSLWGEVFVCVSFFTALLLIELLWVHSRSSSIRQNHILYI